ncbi:hypothetical protein ACSBR2_026793 [Camellia fascicularis]
MWCQWVKSYLLKGNYFWSVKTPSNSSWAWRKLLPLRSRMFHLIKWEVGSGEKISLWHDNWHLSSPLWAKYGDRLLYDTALNSNAKVVSIISNTGWHWPNASSWEVQEIVDNSPPLLTSCLRDKVTWLPSKDGIFNIGSAWNEWRHKWPKVQWADVTPRILLLG